MPKHRSLPIRGFTLAACALAGLLACTESQSSSPTEPSVLAAKPSGVRVPKVKVTEAIPSEAPQETTLDVEVIGSGFDDGSVVEFLLNELPSDVVVDGADFVDDTKLIAHVIIPGTAAIDLYDIEVTTAGGKKGIGSEMFLVKDKNAVEIPVSATFRDADDDGVQSDGGVGPYDAVILAIGNLMLDARVDIPRTLCFDFDGQLGAPLFDGEDAFCDDGYLTTADPALEGGLPAMEVGSTMTTFGQVTWVKQDDAGKGYNWFLRFGMDCERADVGADRLTVTHTTETTWTLETPPGAHAWLCKLPTKGRPVISEAGEFSMPFKLTLVK